MPYYTDNEDDEKLVGRALSAYFRFGGIDQPNKDSGVEVIKGKKYVMLVNTKGILIVYRVRNDGKLKSLKRYPREIEAEIQTAKPIIIEGK